jgi:hypothetical protein
VGCLPIPYSYLELPEIVGVYRDSDGLPSQGRFAIAMGRLGDSTCTTATLEATTDANGVFRFPRQELRSKWTPLVPFDAVASEYSLCHQTDGGAREVYRGIALQSTPRDSITCVDGSRPDALSLHCTGLSAAPRLRRSTSRG